jgi:glutaredoxin
MRLLLIALLFFAALAQAGTLYKSIGPDGQIVYSDQPPQSGRVEKTFDFANLPSSAVPETTTRYREDLEKSMQQRLAAAPSARGPVLYRAAWCGYCRQAEAYLAEKRISYTKIDIDTPDGKAAFAAASGSGKGIPLMVSNGKELRGYTRPAYEAFFAQK